VPVLQLEECASVALDYAHGVHLLDLLLVVLAGETAAGQGLELDYDVGQFHVAFFFEVCENAGAEEELGLADPVEVLV